MKENKLKKLLSQEMNNLSGLLQLSEMLRERVIPLGETGVTSRVFNFWKQENLLMAKQEDNKWVKLNLFEFVWVMAIKNMREVGFSFDKIKEVKKVLTAPILLEEYLGKNKAVTIKKFEETANKILTKKEDIEALKKNFDNPDLPEQMRESGVILNLFYCLAIGVIFHKQINGFFIMGTGEIKEWSNEILDLDFQGGEILTRSHYYFSFSEVILNFINDETNEKYLKPLSIISDEETEVIKAMRNKNFKRIEILPLKEAGTRKKISVIIVKDGNLTDESERQITDILKLKNYESITLKKNNGTQIYFERQFRKNL